MQLSEQWLREWINPPVDTAGLVEALTLLGLEVDRADKVAPAFHGVVVAHVVSREQHPNADRLSFCRVDVGDGELRDVVCGAPNVRQGLKVAFVQVGGELPGNFKIKKASLRGVDSYGMICSANELGLVSSHDGIIELPADAPVGMNLRDYWGLDDTLIDVELTPNRGDCASVLGIARDLSAKFRLPLNYPVDFLKPEINAECIQGTAFKPVMVQDSKACPRYLGRVMTGLNLTLETPRWLRERLERSGLHAIHPVVDVTNYVMLELGQPMHAFDLAQLGNTIVVRRAHQDEAVQLLNDRHVQLSPENLVISDERGVLALAGVMGAKGSAVTTATSAIFLEAAFFDPQCIAKSARSLGLVTDSSYRFERGVDYDLAEKAMARCTQLILSICGGEAGPIMATLDEEQLPRHTPIRLRVAQIERVLGIELAQSEIADMLTRLGMQFESVSGDQHEAGDFWVTPPSYRYDLSQEIDLIEELARLHGYGAIPSSTLSTDLIMNSRDTSQVAYLRFHQHLRDRGYTEAITYSFLESDKLCCFDPREDVLQLQNPLSNELAAMRTSLIPGLLLAAKYNINRQASRVRLFETGLCFLSRPDGLLQEERLAGVWWGARYPMQWGESARTVDFFDMKGDLENLFAELYQSADLSWQPSKHPGLHPGQSADIFLAGEYVGMVGVLHPGLLSRFDLSSAPVCFELNMLSLRIKSTPSYENISKFPAVRRDLAIVVQDKISAEAIARSIRQSAGHLLIDVKIFDIYQGLNIGAGKKSLALSLVFQDKNTTLVDADIHRWVESVVAGLQQEFNATLRA
jgi:phenylalanyl-tRNA synthetase beta chain